jgi:thiamine phosphate synthase YjbQ (UPF0047 family)
MTVFRETFSLDSRGDCDILDITGRVAEVVGNSGISEGIGMAFVSHSTAAISCVEYERGRRAPGSRDLATDNIDGLR